MIRVLKFFVTPTLTYTAQVDESVLHIWIETQQAIDYVCCTCLVSTSNYSLFFKCFVTPTLTYIAQVDESGLDVCFDTHQIRYCMCLISFGRNDRNSSIKMLCDTDFNIYR